MPRQPAVNPLTFKYIENVEIGKLSELCDIDLRPILPCLVRMSLCAPLDTSDKWTVERKLILKCLSGIEVVNSLVSLLSIDFHALEIDAVKEQQLRAKKGGNQAESELISQLTHGVALEFERSDANRKLRLLLSEVLFVMSQIREPRSDFYEKSSELFENEVYLEEVSDVLCIAQAELPSLLSITSVAETLLHMPNGIWLLCRLVANVPDSFEEVCSHLVANGEKQDEDGLGGHRRAEALKRLGAMNPDKALFITSLCVSHCRMPGLAVAMALDQCSFSPTGGSASQGISDIVSFISSLLLGSDLNVRSWFAQFIRTGQKKKPDQETFMVQALRDRLKEELRQVLPSGGHQMNERQAVQACAFIRLYCALKGVASLKFSDEEIQVLLQLITSHPPVTKAGIRFVCLSLCMLLACPYIIGSSELEKQAIVWIKWLLKEASKYESVSGATGSFGEMLLLIAIHFHSNQTHTIADLICTNLGMKSVVKTNLLTRVKQIFTQEIFTESVVAAHAAKVPVTKHLNAAMTGYLPIQCIYQLLKSRAFSKHKVPIKHWILKQMKQSRTPLHPLLPQLIEVFVNSIIVPNPKIERPNDPFTGDEVRSVYVRSIMNIDCSKIGKDSDVQQEESQSLTSQLLMLYYLLLYNDVCLQNMKANAGAHREVMSYSPQLLAEIPIKYLLLQAQKEQQLYAGIFSPLLKLLATHYPHLCLVEDWLDAEITSPLTGLVTPMSLCNNLCTPQNLDEALQKVREDPVQATILLEELAQRSAPEVMPFTEVIMSHLKNLLHPEIPRRVLALVKSIWLKLNALMPRKLRVMTVNALYCGGVGSFRIKNHTEDDITTDPLLVLRCDERVFRCPHILEVVLRVLEAFLYASRSFLSMQIQANPILSVDKGGQNKLASWISQERDELRVTLIATQESAAVQLLLENCLAQPSDQEEGLLSNLREVQCLICSHLHQRFIADPSLAKLVHFQGYPSELLPVAVAGIPSMHICVDYIPELLSQPQMDKQIFAIELMSHLSLQYALPKSLGVAKLSINVMSTLLSVLNRERRVEFFLPTVPALVRICRAFPPLCEDAIALLVQLGKVCGAQLSTENISDLDVLSDDANLPKEGTICHKGGRDSPSHGELLNCLQKTFCEIVKNTAVLRPLQSS